MNNKELPQDFVYSNYIFSFDSGKVQIPVVYNYLNQESYWAQGIPESTVERSVQNSICIGVYDCDHQDVQMGFGRLITDRATFAYLADIFILEPHRGKGLSKLMVQAFCDLVENFRVRRTMLATKDAHGLYTQFGFEPLSSPERTMVKKGVTY